MKSLTCEMCNGTDMVKQDGFFVCQNCGTKYSVEEAKKMMVEGTVKIDASDKIDNWRELARRAKDRNDNTTALKYYDMILEEDADDWEAFFYSIYCSSINCATNGEICAKAKQFKDSLHGIWAFVFKIDETDKRNLALIEVTEKTQHIATYLGKSALSFYYSLPSGPSGHKGPAVEALEMCAGILICWGDLLYGKKNEDSYYLNTALSLYKQSLELVPPSMKSMFNYRENLTPSLNIYRNVIKRIQEHEPDYQFVAKSGCYVATCVYGSYDCPEVWTLRRYRDYHLAETWYGRAFIRSYYAISPTLVKWFGKTNWFKKMWRGKLDRMVNNLKDKGYESTPYEDRDW